MQLKKHACPTFKHFLHGADYNPEQWLPDKTIWDQDMDLMQLANCNEMTVGIFSWAVLEPREGEYDFSLLDEILDRVHRSGGKVILATPSGARPRWLAERYPQVLRVGEDGVREHFRGRHNHCLTSPVYRRKVSAINRLLAQRYGRHPAVVAWHISNEYSGECRCPLCADAFRGYLREKFGNDIGALNRAYWTSFWSHTYDSFDQIEPPGTHTEGGTHGLNLDWKRFTTRQTLSFLENETAPIREYSPHLPVTTNMMFAYPGLDYNTLARGVDIASWDSYPDWHCGDDVLTAQRTAFWHDYFRSLKQRPFLLMESTPSLVNWKPCNRLKCPGLDVLSSLQAVAHGSDSVQYFQWRKGRGGSEKFHGAVVGHDGTADTRVFRAVQETGRRLRQMDTAAGTLTRARAAVLVDWENLWALEDCQGFLNEDKGYFETCYAYHREFWRRGINCDVVSPLADLSGYRLVVAPMLYLTDAPRAENLRRYVHSGGTLYATYFLGTVDENDLCHLGGIPGAGLGDVFGITAQETDTLCPHQRRYASFGGEEHELQDFCELLQLRGAEALAVYADGWYRGSPAVTAHSFGRGRAIYQGCRDSGSLRGRLFDRLLPEAGLSGVLTEPVPRGVTAQTRTDGERVFVFLQNYSEAASPAVFLCRQMEDPVSGERLDSLTLGPWEMRLLCYEGEEPR